MHTPYFLTCTGRKCIMVGSSGRKANISTDAQAVNYLPAQIKIALKYLYITKSYLHQTALFK